MGRPRNKDRLTVREREALALVAMGYTTEEIALLMGVLTETSKHTIKLACARFEAKTRSEAVYRAIQRGWLQPNGTVPQGEAADPRIPHVWWKGVPENLDKRLRKRAYRRRASGEDEEHA